MSLEILPKALSDWFTVLSSLGWDVDLFRTIHLSWRQPWLDVLFLLLTYTGDGHIQIPLLLAACFWKQTRSLGLAILATYASSGIIRLLLKDIFDRPRPTNLPFADPVTWPYEAPAWFLKTFDIVPYGNSSFPSGHTTTSFAIAFTVAWWFHGTKQAWIGYIAMAWATGVALSRVYIGVHFPADVVSGAALALVFTSLIALIWHRNGWAPSRRLV